MTSIGDTLRRERLRRNLELPAIAAELRIAVRFLQAIEADDLAKLPGGVFTKSFIRQYAAVLGLDGDEMAAEVKRAYDPEPPSPEEVEKARPDVPAIPMSGGEPWNSVRDGHGPMPAWLRAGGLLVVLMVVSSGIYYLWERPRHDVQTVATHPAPPPQSTPAPVTAPPETPPATTPDGTAAGGDAQSAVTNPSTAASTSNPNASVRVAITADEEVWMRVDTNGKYQFTATLKAHETRNIDTDGEVKIRFGNAGVVSVTLNGNPVGAVGPKGQPRTVQFTSGGFQIVSPVKAPEDLDRR